MPTTNQPAFTQFVIPNEGTNPREATLEYSSYNDETPMLAGGPEYQLQPGVQLVVFASSFASSVPPGYLIQGSRDELPRRVEALRDAHGNMSPDQLKVHEINEDDRRIQLALYDKLCLPSCFQIIQLAYCGSLEAANLRSNNSAAAR